MTTRPTAVTGHAGEGLRGDSRPASAMPERIGDRYEINPKAHPGQTDRNEPVERLRRIHLNDLENLPFFVIAGLFYCLTAPSLLLAQCLFYGYVVTRLLHFVAYATARTHDLRALLWTPGSLIIVFMAGRTLVFAALGV